MIRTKQVEHNICENEMKETVVDELEHVGGDMCSVIKTEDVLESLQHTYDINKVIIKKEEHTADESDILTVKKDTESDTALLAVKTETKEEIIFHGSLCDVNTVMKDELILEESHQKHFEDETIWATKDRHKILEYCRKLHTELEELHRRCNEAIKYNKILLSECGVTQDLRDQDKDENEKLQIKEQKERPAAKLPAIYTFSLQVIAMPTESGLVVEVRDKEDDRNSTVVLTKEGRHKFSKKVVTVAFHYFNLLM